MAVYAEYSHDESDLCMSMLDKASLTMTSFARGISYDICESFASHELVCRDWRAEGDEDA